MDVQSALASHSYQRARAAAAPSPKSAANAQSTTALGAAVSGFLDTVRAGEDAARAAMTSGADPQSLVQALASTELAVETAVTLRDKMVEAYQEILRMQV